jgi:CHAT domain-containing protein
LIENYALHYSPAIEVFRYTRRAHQRTSSGSLRYLLVANPSGMPAADGKALSALPGSEKEVRTIAQLAPPGSAMLLQRRQADEASVRAAMTGAKVIHLATHGVIDNRNPLASFLAFGRINSEPDSDGRLTAEEVYRLDLNADLVVLSACRTGLGRITGDGVAGLARAFFYAGTASVISTLWDVIDGPTAQLFADFYRSLGNDGKNGKSEALRDAQLHLLRSLQSGRVREETPFGKLTLPEDPVFWAGYVLLGEPQ